ncbi:thrombomodulin [Carlito syrichta]|uniref:Thrombomodulin n=1 Tax=Carlito syrichta TaxID=1868482 RepID=A0A3Q0E4T7_CARSF|nr:thrombomodulin [Carlito syrichta]
MLWVILLSVLARSGPGLPAPAEPKPQGSQCVGHDCFAVFGERATFRAASQTCEKLRGHLMTVRSSVAADAIALLLSSHGAADAVLQADGRSCATPPEHSCDLCEHFCVRGSDVPGSSYSCMCETGYKLAADLHHCEDVDDCALVPSPCLQRCINTQGGFKCDCFPGYDLVDGECVEPPDPCFGSKCESQCEPEGPTSYRCICAEGFAPMPLEPHRCQIFCNQTSCPAICDPNTLSNCECPEGYILDEGFMCTDIDECQDGSYCSDVCHNLLGSYECLCGPDSALAGQMSTDCDPIKVNGDGDGDSDGGSGEPPASPAPGSTPSPPPAGRVHSGALIGISIASLSLVAALLALLCHLRKKQGTARAKMEYKSASPAKEVVLQQVRTEHRL